MQWLFGEQDTRTTFKAAEPKEKKTTPNKTSFTKGLVTVTRNPHMQQQPFPTPAGICLWARLEHLKFCGAADSAVQVSLHLFHIIPDPEQSCMMGKLHKLISVIKADKIPFSSIQRSLFPVVYLPANLVVFCLPACLQETVNDFIFLTS